MTTIILLLLLLLTVAALAASARAVRRDGLGHRRPPRSHPDWWEGVELR
ncbi:MULTISPECIES: hypothetical protein [Isoptericola]|uniref:Uncharacterized protein n=1 Tax=Isoptericola sediminis TaxID=2733572 RepID=A0A849K5Z9_9MICO|nr:MULTISPECIES: hypothetical protein [Isoptericola]MDO8144186.1 hypothetical protein [Isoptericola sp. 178]MDO8148040.1 hypothetical protein [Isoptericola sp. b515]MDO8151515.1 hypothetical protein [Isoptericola sp. b408]NNU27850.1 hypothetical protein [Isoptericola sediminis]